MWLSTEDGLVNADHLERITSRMIVHDRWQVLGYSDGQTVIFATFDTQHEALALVDHIFHILRGTAKGATTDQWRSAS